LRVWREMMADHCGPQCDERETDHVIIQGPPHSLCK
jgi:hypothetical protein